MAIRQERPELLAFSASGHEGAVDGWTATSGEKTIDFSEQIAWFGDILKIVGPFVEIGLRLLFDKSPVGETQYAAERGAWSARRWAAEQWRTLWANLVPHC